MQNFLFNIYDILVSSLNYFWNPKNKFLKWTNRILLIVIFCLLIMNITIHHQYNTNKKIVQDQNTFRTSTLNKNKKIAKNKENDINKKEKTNSNYIVNTKKGFEDGFDIAKVNQAKNIDKTVQPPDNFITVNYIDKLSKNGETENDKKMISELMFFKAGQTQYFYENMLAPSFDLKNVNIGFDMYSSTLYIGPGVPLRLQKPIQERAQDIYQQSELSVVNEYLTIEFVN